MSLDHQSLDSVPFSVLSPVAEEPRDISSPHHDNRDAWIVLVASYLMQVVIMGIMHTFGIFYLSFLQEFGASEGVTGE